jgi:hypothetical protein
MLLTSSDHGSNPWPDVDDATMASLLETVQADEAAPNVQPGVPQYPNLTPTVNENTSTMSSGASSVVYTPTSSETGSSEPSSDDDRQ